MELKEYIRGEWNIGKSLSDTITVRDWKKTVDLRQFTVGLLTRSIKNKLNFTIINQNQLNEKFTTKQKDSENLSYIKQNDGFKTAREKGFRNSCGFKIRWVIYGRPTGFIRIKYQQAYCPEPAEERQVVLYKT